MIPPYFSLDDPTDTFRVTLDIQMSPKGMQPKQACQLIATVLESAYTFIRLVDIRQCSQLDDDGLALRNMNEEA